MKKTLKTVLGIVVGPFLLIIGTLLTYFVAKGYRFDFDNGQFEQTGVISVETKPRRTEITLDGTAIGKSPKAVSGINEGKHTVTLSRNGYQTWTMNIDIKPQQLVPLQVVLFKETPDTEVIFDPLSLETSIDGERIDLTGLFGDPDSRIAVFTTGHYVTSETGDESLSAIDIWTYPVKRRFWEFDAQPVQIATLPPDFWMHTTESAPEPASLAPRLEFHPSPDGQKILMRLIRNDESEGYYLLDTGLTNETLQEIPYTPEANSAPPTWSMDSTHLIFTKNNELRSYNTETMTQTVLSERQNPDPFIWTSNESGQLFILVKTETTQEVVQNDPDGSNRAVLLSLPFEEDSQELFKENGGSEPELTDSFSRIHSITLTPKEDQLILFSDQSIFLYTLADQQIEAYPADNPHFQSFCPDEQTLLFTDNADLRINIFRFLIEEGDPLHTLGTTPLIDLASTATAMRWHPDGHNIFFRESAQPAETGTSLIYSVDIENNQLFTVAELNTSTDFTVEDTGKSIVGICSDNTLCRIIFSD